MLTGPRLRLFLALVLMLGATQVRQSLAQTASSPAFRDLIAVCGQEPRRGCVVDVAVSFVDSALGPASPLSSSAPLDDRSADWIARVAWRLAAAGETERALAAFQRAAQHYSNNRYALRASAQAIGFALAQQGQRAAVYRLLEALPAQVPYRVEILAFLATRTSDASDLDRAFEEAKVLAGNTRDQAIDVVAHACGQLGLVDRVLAAASASGFAERTMAAGLAGAITSLNIEAILAIRGKLPPHGLSATAGAVAAALISGGRLADGEALLAPFPPLAYKLDPSLAHARVLLARAKGDERMIQSAIDDIVGGKPALSQIDVELLAELARVSGHPRPLVVLREALPQARMFDNPPSRSGVPTIHVPNQDHWYCTAALIDELPEWMLDCARRLAALVRAEKATGTATASEGIRVWFFLQGVDPAAAWRLMKLAREQQLEIVWQDADSLCMEVAKRNPELAQDMLPTLPPSSLVSSCEAAIFAGYLEKGVLEKALAVRDFSHGADERGELVLSLAPIVPR